LDEAELKEIEMSSAKAKKPVFGKNFIRDCFPFFYSPGLIDPVFSFIYGLSFRKSKRKKHDLARSGGRFLFYGD